MTVLVHGSTWMSSDLTRHQGKGVGDGNWVISYLPGRTLTLPQAVAAIRVAEEVTPVIHLVAGFALELGLTALEAVNLAATECDWPDPPPDLIRKRIRSSRRRWWR